MSDAEQKYSVDEICTLTDLPRRRLRFYIQQGVVSPPMGAKRGAYYTNQHLEQILEIKKWQRAGLSLERIRELLHDDSDAPPAKPRHRGGIEVWSHLLLDDGVEMHINPSRAELTPEALREFASQVTKLYSTISQKKSEESDHV